MNVTEFHRAKNTVKTYATLTSLKNPFVGTWQDMEIQFRRRVVKKYRDKAKEYLERFAFF